MKQFFYLTSFCILALTACTSEYKKAGKGIEYKIIADGSGNKVLPGNFIQVHMKQMYKSSVLDTTIVDSREIKPTIDPYDTLSYPAPFFKIFGEVRKGDSLVLRLLADSAIKENPQQLPPFVKKGGYLYTTVKVINIFTTKEQVDSANSAEMKIALPKIYKKQVGEVEKILAQNKMQLGIDDNIIKDYLTKNSIVATKTSWGTYVAIHNEGTGDKIDNKQVVTVNYTGRTLDSGKVFDSNTDPKFNHVQPYQVNMAQLGGVILGWSDGLMQLKKGAKATFYIPSTLGYGLGGNPQGGIKPNANLVFDMEIVDVVSAEVFAAQAEEMKKKMQEMQKMQPENIQKTPPLKK